MSTEPRPMHQGVAADLPFEGTMPGFGGANGWLNSEPLTPESLRGRVVLVQFWTYTCINWRRTHPYVRAWAAHYKDAGLVVIGVHTPEFGFEHDRDNVIREARDMKVVWPIAIDNDFRVWRAFANHYWPALYFVDVNGRIRHHRFGEGDYERSEMVIRQLLAEGGAAVPAELARIDAEGAEVTADWTDLRSPETYLGYEQTTGFEAPGGVEPDRPHTYSAPPRLRLNDWALSGNWTVRAGFAALNEPGGRIAFQFHARDAHLVMGQTGQGKAVRYRVSVDGRPAPGVDVDAEGSGIVTEQRMYTLVRQSPPIRDRRFEIEFLDAGVEAFVFTFG